MMRIEEETLCELACCIEAAYNSDQTLTVDEARTRIATMLLAIRGLLKSEYLKFYDSFVEGCDLEVEEELESELLEKKK